jgi:hypothetical protein
MKVDTQPFPSVNMVGGYDQSVRRQLDFAYCINMAGLAPRRAPGMKRPIPTIIPKRGKGIYHGRASKACEESTTDFFRSPQKV